MPEFSDEAEAIQNVSGTERILAVNVSDGEMIFITPAQLKAYIGSGLPANFFDSASKIQVGFLPNVKLSDKQFQQLKVAGVPQDIEFNTTWLTNFILSVGAAQNWSSGGGTAPTKLATPVLTFVSATENSVTWSWTRESNGQTSLFQVFINGAWSNASTGSETSKQITGLGASTDYPVRVLSRGSGFLDSEYATGTHATTAPTGLPTPVAPAAVFDAVARKLKFTHPTYPNGIEYRINGGAWTVYVANTLIAVGDNAVAANYYEARVKAVSGTNNPGDVVGNTAIVAKDTSVPAVSATTPVELVNHQWDGSTHKLIYAALGGNAQRTRFREYIPAGQDGYVRAVLGGIQLLLDDLPGEFNSNPLFGIFKNMVNNHIDYRFRNSTGQTNYNNLTTSSATVVGELFALGSNLLFRYSLDNEVTFVTGFTMARPAGIDLYLKANDGDTGSFLGDIKGGGLSLNTSLT